MEKLIAPKKRARANLYWAIQKPRDNADGILKSFIDKEERDIWIAVNEDREIMLADHALVRKARKEFILDHPCELPYELPRD